MDFQKSNFVILGSDWDLYKYSYADVMNLPNVIYTTPKNIFGKLYLLFKIHFSIKINSICRLPFKHQWRKLFNGFEFNNAKPICFLFFANWNQLDDELLLVNYFKEKYKGCKCVLFFQDIFSTQKKLYSRQPYDVDELKRKYDIIISYDRVDSVKYGFLYHPTVLSYTQIDCNDIIPCDVFFIGKAKDRLKVVTDVFKKLKDLGCVCRFILLDVPEDQQVYKDEIIYTNEFITYYENLKYMCASKCLLEVLQTGAVGFSFRTLEAVLYGKKILSNNKTMSDLPFYTSNNVFLFDTIDDITSDMVKLIKDGNRVCYDFKERYSPKSLLTFIVSQFD